MAIKAEELLGVNYAEVDRFEYMFDSVLKEKAKSNGGLLGQSYSAPDKPGYRTFMAIVVGTMSETTKNELKKRYTDAGWLVARVLNSSDNNERPGLASIIFYIKE